MLYQKLPNSGWGDDSITKFRGSRKWTFYRFGISTPIYIYSIYIYISIVCLCLYACIYI